MSDLENQNQEQEEVNEVYQAIIDVSNAILDGESSRENQAIMLKSLREKITKKPVVLNDAFTVVLDTARDVINDTVADSSRSDLALLKEANEIIKLVAKKGSEEHVNYAADVAFDCLESTTSSKRHQLEMLKTINYITDKNPEISEQFVGKIIPLASANIVKSSKSCDAYDKEIVDESVYAIESVGDYGVNNNNDNLTQTAVNSLSEVISHMHPDMANNTRRAMFNSVAKPVVEFIQADPYFYKKTIRQNIFNSMANFQYNSRFVGQAERIKDQVEKVKTDMDNAFTKAIVKNLKQAKA